ncbi:hypothetical protein NHL50_19040 [Acidimicrobiia bacterium EGI L10123]|uniref:hypothetical protein n=1 Tax=Salinilacustrithrix flava TaxID=2957203 RepID=UPI003D7C3195|nr:hypothetical protein [Acidimicrobiia bacterium EGI L10123]
MSQYHETFGYYAQANKIDVAKLAANREKDVEFTTALVRAGLVDVDVLLERARSLERPQADVDEVVTRIRRCAADASRPPLAEGESDPHVKAAIALRKRARRAGGDGGDVCGSTRTVSGEPCRNPPGCTIPGH